MEQARTKWNDDRLDHLSGQVDSLRHHLDERFERQEARIDAKFTAFEQRIDAKFVALDSRLTALDGKFDALQRTVIVTLGGILAAFGSVFLAAQL